MASAHNQEIEERLCEATVAVLQSVPSHSLNIVNVNKALFYADLVALRDMGSSITQSAYLALRAGPVVASYDKRVVGGMQRRGWAQQQTAGREKPLTLTGGPTSLPLLTPPQLAILQDVAKSVASQSASTVSAYSHDNPAWQHSIAQGIHAGRGPVKINMMLAMQQLLDDEAWLCAPASEAELQAFAAADLEVGETWA